MTTGPGPLADRRAAMKTGAVGLLAFQLGGCDMLMSPRDAREKGADIRKLSSTQVLALEAFAEALVPGAREAGIAHFVDANLARPVEEVVLSIRYFDFPPPYFDFYADGLAALDALTMARSGNLFTSLNAGAAREIVKPMLGGTMEGWDGPPLPLFYLAVRSDAADLVYGTVDAFERMGLPYVPHIEPPSRW